MKASGSKTGFDFTCPLTRKQAEEICAQGREVMIFVLMELAARLAKYEQEGLATTPSTPSGMVPPHAKPTVRKRGNKPGAKAGHAGTRREPAQVTRHEEHPPLKRCPDCGGRLKGPAERRYRLIEEIIDTQPEVTEHSIPRHWCARCGKFVEPPVADAMPGSTFGHRIVTLTAWLHYGLGTTLSQITEVLNHHLHFKLSQGGLAGAWQRLANVLFPWYEQIGEQAKHSGVLHADETGWRVDGQTNWLWCFTTKNATFYMINRSRGSPALSRFFTETFDGVLVTDFLAAYNAVSCGGRQVCLPHLFRELEKVNEIDRSPSWAEFSRKLKRLLRDAIRLSRRTDMTQERFASRRARLGQRIEELIEMPCENPNVKRLAKRLGRYRDALFTFLDHPDVPSDNNHAEREIRPAVIIRKNSLFNRSEAGANAQAILMSLYRTLKLRSLDPLETIVSALRDYILTGTLPPLPA
jgi:transposase